MINNFLSVYKAKYQKQAHLRCHPSPTLMSIDYN